MKCQSIVKDLFTILFQIWFIYKGKFHLECIRYKFVSGYWNYGWIGIFNLHIHHLQNKPLILFALYIECYCQFYFILCQFYFIRCQFHLNSVKTKAHAFLCNFRALLILGSFYFFCFSLITLIIIPCNFFVRIFLEKGWQPIRMSQVTKL